MNGSQEKAFEELVCQLAHLSPPEKAKRFIRKEGSGGDAGVECYWADEDGKEVAWQAKYFLNGPNPSQWDQIDNSVETALKKHPQIKKYIICLPIDLPDSRAEREGVRITTQQDHWDGHKEKWKQLASSQNMEVDFEYWGKHELVNMLQIDAPSYSGRIIYWFNTPALTSRKLAEITERSKISLGERYSSEINVELQISDVFDGIGKTETFISEVKELTSEFRDDLSENEKSLLDYQELLDKLHALVLRLESFRTQPYTKNDLENLSKLFDTPQNSINLIIETIRNEITHSLSSENECDIGQRNLSKGEDTQDTHKSDGDGSKNSVLESKLNSFTQINHDIYRIKSYFASSKAQACVTKAMLIFGEAGIGKSHLLCDIALKRINTQKPTLLVLGQHYPGGNPIDFIALQLGLVGYSHQQVLGSLDAFGESKNTRFLIIIDAINEGANYNEWTNHLMAFLVELQRFDNIALVLSCRETYVPILIPPMCDNKVLVRIHHPGFRGNQEKAAKEYLLKQKIARPSMPMLGPEYTNPLFLKTCCYAINSRGEHEFPKGLNSFSRLFEFYIDSIETVVAQKKGYQPTEKLVLNLVKEFACALYPDNIRKGLPTAQARDLINRYDPNPGVGESLFNLLCHEGLFTRDVTQTAEQSYQEIVRFTFERYSDYLIALMLLDKYSSVDALKDALKKDAELGRMMAPREYTYWGIIEAFSVCVPELYGQELIEMIGWFNELDVPEQYELINRAFYNNILWRSPTSISQKSLELLYRSREDSNEIIISVTTEPDHPWNADYLDSRLLDLSLPERDKIWSCYIAAHYYDDDEWASPAKSIVDWCFEADLALVDKERLRLTAVFLIWCLTTSNRKLRDESTKSLTRVLSYIPDQIATLVDKYSSCNDPYLIERLYATVYGALCMTDSQDIIKNAAQSIYKSQFENGAPYPHILLRDYARGIMEYALHKDALPECVTDINQIRPPYTSTWPLHVPSEKEMDELCDDKYDSIKSSVLGFLGDFGKYSMSDVQYWSDTPIGNSNFIMGHERKRQFAERLPDGLREKYVADIEQVIKAEADAEANFDIEEFLKELKYLYEDDENGGGIALNEGASIEDEILAVLPDCEKENFKWVNALYSNSPVKFNEQDAKKWVCRRAYTLGWSNDRFEDFEKYYVSREYSRSPKKIERIGKKYQWIAYHELLAHMADNLKWIGSGAVDEPLEYYDGVWQLSVRDIDPTLLIRKTGNPHWDNNETNPWWEAYDFEIEKTDDNFAIEKWLWSQANLPNFQSLSTVISPTGKTFLTLFGFSQYSEDIRDGNDRKRHRLDYWYRINTCVIKKSDLQKFKGIIKEQKLESPDIVGQPPIGEPCFLGEYPWHPRYIHLPDWLMDEEYSQWEPLKRIVQHAPVCEYSWSPGHPDFSIEDSIGFYAPSQLLIRDLNLSQNIMCPGEWFTNTGEGVFLDPSVFGKGRSYALFSKDLLSSWLEQNDLLLIWLLGGEKQWFSPDSDKFYGRQVFNFIEYYDGNACFDACTNIREEPGRDSY